MAPPTAPKRTFRNGLATALPPYPDSGILLAAGAGVRRSAMAEQSTNDAPASEPPPKAAPPTVPEQVAAHHLNAGHHHGHARLPPLRFIEELKRRNVGRVAVLYIVVSYVVLEVFEMFFHLLEMPPWTGRAAVLLAVIGFPITMLIAWAYEITPDGLKPTDEVPARQSIGAQTGKRLDRAIFALMAVALAYFITDKFWLSSHGTVAIPVHPTAMIAATNAQPAVAMPEKSIAVLPFVDMSGNRDQQYFADGMAEELLNLLGKIPELTVTGRTSSFRFNENSEDVAAIGKALGATYIVEGSVRRFGDRVRVTAQLIDTRSGTHRWSETYDRGVTDVLNVQSEIALNVVRALQLEVAPYVLNAARPTLVSSAAYDAYLRGLHVLDRMDQPGLEEAVANFQHARELDPAFAPAAEGLARARIALAYWGFVPSRTGFEQARQAAEQALKLEPNSAFARGVLCGIYTEYDWNWPAADRESKRIIELAPGSPAALLYAADERMATGHLDESLQLLDTAIAADPFNSELYIERSWVYLRLGRLAEAESDSRRVLDIRPSFAWAHYYLAIVLLAAEKPEEALAELRKEPAVGLQLAGLAVAYQALHRTKDADAAMARLQTDHGADLAMTIAEAYAYGGQRNLAFAWLDKAFAQKDFNLYYIKGDPLLKTLVPDARYKAFLRKMNLPE
jgi:TolB-like protein/Tfp pilus assembly protein PilF